MINLEKENQELKNYIKLLEKSDIQKTATIDKLNSIGVSLAEGNDISSILENILINIKEFTNADAGTIYLAHGNKLTFKHISNDTLNISDTHNHNDYLDDIWNYLEIKNENSNMITVNCALRKKIIKIDDIEHNNEYDFSGTKAFEKRTGYKSKSMLVIPMLEEDNTLIGVLQLINKQAIDSKNILPFTQEDVELAHSLASQATVAVNKFLQNKLIAQQSKMAAMGEMIDVIAHQWKQPLSVIGTNTSRIDIQLGFGRKIEDEMLEDISTNIKKQIKHLVNTLDEFRSFLRPDKPKHIIKISKLIESVLVLMHDELYSNEIKTEIVGDTELEFEVVENEIKHIFINILNNAKDAFNSNKIKDRKFIFCIQEKDGFSSIDMIDTAGGIPIELINNIFKANFTTKTDGKGTGIGLYMSTQIAEKNGGELSVKNVKNGAKFTLNIMNL